MNVYTATIPMGISRKTWKPVELEPRAMAEDEPQAIRKMLSDVEKTRNRLSLYIARMEKELS